MDILEVKNVEDYDNDVIKFLSHFEFPGTKIKFEGSSKYAHLKYKSDYDVLFPVKTSTPASEVFTNLSRVLERIEKDPDTYFTELKMQTKDNQKFRFYHGDSLSFSQFAEHYDTNLKYFKIDMVIYVKNRFFETSGTYRLMPDPTLSRDKVIKDLKDDISKHKQEGNYYKVLKRMFSLYVMDRNREQVEFLISIFNSELGRLYEKICNLKAIELVHEFYPDEKTKERIDTNLSLLHENFDLKKLDRKINDYNKLLQREAKKIYTGLKADARYP
jgi:hypothetical protein